MSAIPAPATPPALAQDQHNGPSPNGPHNGPSPNGPPPLAAAPPNRLALLVDPDPDVLRSTSLLIEALGYDVETLSEAEHVLDAVHKHRPGILIQETQMPGLNLSGLMAALRSDPSTAGVRVAFFSAVLDLAATAQRHQAWGHLSKPFGFQELAHLLERALGPPPGKVALDVSRDVEKEIRLAFREYRNLLAALNNYVVLLEKSADLDPPAKAAVERVQDLILMMEARTVRLRSYILSLVGPAEPMPTPPTFERSSSGADRASRPPRASKPTKASGLQLHGRLGQRVDVSR